jgi:hypothetical protein
MKLRNLMGLMFAGALVFASCKKDENTNNNNGGNNNTTPVIATLDCSNAISGQATVGATFNGSAIVSYTGGNGATYATGSVIPSTGVTGLNATLVGGTLANGNGQLEFAVSGTPASEGTASFALNFAGKSCTITLPVAVPLPHIAKWFYDKFYDSAFCCLSTWEANRTLTFIPDSSGLIDFPQTQYFLDLKANNTFSELWFNNQNYSGNYIIGGDSLRLNYSGGGAQRNKVLSLTSTELIFSDRSSLYKGSAYEGDTLLSRYNWYMKK